MEKEGLRNPEERPLLAGADASPSTLITDTRVSARPHRNRGGCPKALVKFRLSWPFPVSAGWKSRGLDVALGETNHPSPVVTGGLLRI